MQSCGNCRHFEPWMTGDTEGDAPGQCTWEPAALPLSWAWVRREVVGVNADTDADSCPQHEPT